VELQYEHGNYVLEMSPAAYELLKGAIKKYVHHHDNYTIQANDQKDQQGLCVSTPCDIGTKGPSLLLLLALIDPFCVILSIHCLIWLSNNLLSCEQFPLSSIITAISCRCRIVLYRVHLLRLCMLCGLSLYGTVAYYFFYFVRSRMYSTPYTPYKYEGYKLNKKKALDKKVQQCNRSVDMELQYKHGNYVLEMSLAAYEFIITAISCRCSKNCSLPCPFTSALHVVWYKFIRYCCLLVFLFRTQYGSISASNSSSDGPLVPISHSPHRKDVKKRQAGAPR
jgi:hypothetical protein